MPAPRGGAPAVSPHRRVAELSLPAPRPRREATAFWPWLALAAIGCWLGGWALRLK